MSSFLKLVKVEQPPYRGIGNRWTEELSEFEEECGSCRGSGWHWGEDECGERIKKDCLCCEGSGKMAAKVEVKWEPGKKNG